MTLCNLLEGNHVIESVRSKQTGKDPKLVDWSRADDCSIAQFQYELDLLLCAIDIPSLGTLESVDYYNCTKLIDNYYDSIVACLKSAALRCLPTKSSGSTYSEYVIPG